MNKTLIITTILVLLGLLLSACAPVSIGITPPGGPGDSGGNGEGGQPQISNNLIYVLVAASVLIALVALLRK
jgi:hypothetical protein